MQPRPVGWAFRLISDARESTETTARTTQGLTGFQCSSRPRPRVAGHLHANSSSSAVHAETRRSPPRTRSGGRADLARRHLHGVPVDGSRRGTSGDRRSGSVRDTGHGSRPVLLDGRACSDPPSIDLARILNRVTRISGVGRSRVATSSHGPGTTSSSSTPFSRWRNLSQAHTKVLAGNASRTAQSTA